MLKLFAGLLALLAGTLTASADTTGNINWASKIELVAIPSITIPDRQFLVGDDHGPQVLLGGMLRIPAASGKLPVVVLVHESGGIGSNFPYWEQEFGRLGIATFSFDAMTGRGLPQGTSANQRVLGRLNMIIDIYHSLEILAKHPRIDPERVVIMGFSRGGQATLYASEARFQAMWNKSGIKPLAYLPFYPDCGTTYRDDTNVTGPIHIFHGTVDSYNPIAPCKAFMARLIASGHDVKMSEYPHAEHSFDGPISPNPPIVSKGSQSVRACHQTESDNGVLINDATGKPFTYDDECVKLDPKVGADPEARELAAAEITAYLKDLFKLK